MNAAEAIGSETLEVVSVWSAVSAVCDPELGDVTIGDLGLVREVTCIEGVARVMLAPTFLGCPALSIMANDVVAAGLRAGATSVDVGWAYNPPWTTADISESGRHTLGAMGIAVPSLSEDGEPCVFCPFCGSTALESMAPVASTACRSMSWCSDCRNVVEVMRGAEPVEPIASIPVALTPRRL